ncbi:hypothetical protein J7L13_00945 [bacterium]|nr:hypothetical protein [bacterium]
MIIPPKKLANLTRKEQRDLIDKIILETLEKGRINHWTDLERKVISTYPSFATPSKFKTRMKKLLERGYIERAAIGIYQITEKGRRYLKALRIIYEENG